MLTLIAAHFSQEKHKIDPKTTEKKLSVTTTIRKTAKIDKKTAVGKIIKRRHWPLCVLGQTEGLLVIFFFIMQLRTNRYWLIDMPINMNEKAENTEYSHRLHSKFPHRLCNIKQKRQYKNGRMPSENNEHSAN